MSTWTPFVKKSVGPTATGRRRKSRNHPSISQLESRQLFSGTPAWQQADIGVTGALGSAAVAGSTLSVTGAGTGLHDGSDAGHFSYVPLTGDGEIDAHLSGGSINSAGQIALMMRSTLNTSSADVSVQWTSTNAVKYEHRLSSGGWASDDVPYSSQTNASYLRLVRYGNQIAAYDSTDGSSWISVGSDTVALGATIQIGVFVASGNTGVTSWASVADVSVGSIDQPFITSWIGNSFGGGDNWVQGEIGAMDVLPDGTGYTDSNWDEGGHEAGIYKNGQMVGALQDTHGWGRTGGTAVTSDGQYIYIAMEQTAVYGAGGDYPATGTNWYAIRRYHLDGSLASFVGGRGWNSDMIIASTTNPVTGLAVSNGQLIATVAGDNVVLTYTLSNMTPTGRWAIPNPTVIAAANDGSLWIDSAPAGQAPKVLHLAASGSILPGEIDGLGDPTAMAITPAGYLLIADDGPAKQVFEYQLTGLNATRFGGIGQYGGLMSGTPGEVSPAKFDGLAGVGMDSAGNLIVSTSAYGTTIRSLTRTLVQNWEVDGLEFVDVADVDPASDGTDVYTKDHEYTVDPTKPAGQQWTLAATTIDATDYPEDPRLLNDSVDGLGMSTVYMRDVDGVKLMYIADEYSASVTVYRFDGDIAVPAAMFARNNLPQIPNSPSTGSWVWVDSNGDGQFNANEFTAIGPGDFTQWGLSVDSSGTIWLASGASGVRSIPVTGFTSAGAPQLNASAGTSVPVPGDFTELTRAIYDPSTDSMLLGGYSTAAPHTGTEWGELGTTIEKYTSWSTSPTKAWETLLPYSPDASPSVVVKSMTVAGGKVFAGISQTGQILEYDATTGALDDTIYPGPEVAGNTGWFDTTNSINAFQQSNGQIDLFAEEVTQNKVIEYQLTQAAPTAVAATVSTGAKAISVSWTAAAGATSYQVSRSTDGTHFSPINSTASTAFVDAAINAGVTYFYRVQALGPYANSASSATAVGVLPTGTDTMLGVSGPARNGFNTPTGSTNGVSISSVGAQSATGGWGLVTAATAVNGLSAGDVGYLSTPIASTPAAQYPGADVVFRLNGAYSNVLGSTVVLPGGTANGTVTFEVLADGRPIYIRGARSTGSSAVPFSLNVSGVTVLDLRILNGGDGSGFDHADWVGPTLVVGRSTLVPPVVGITPNGSTGNTATGVPATGGNATGSLSASPSTPTMNATTGSIYASLPAVR